MEAAVEEGLEGEMLLAVFFGSPISVGQYQQSGTS
jgi:hypothetical protein